MQAILGSSDMGVMISVRDCGIRLGISEVGKRKA